MKKNAFILILAFAFLIALTTANRLVGQDNNVAVTLQDVESFTYCCISHKGPFSDMPEVIGRLMLSMQQQNLMPMGPMIGIFQGAPTAYNMESMEWEVGFPVIDQAMFQAPLEKKQWVYTTVVTATHAGSYEKSGETIGQILYWMETNGHAQAGPILEKYMDMNPDQLDSNNLKTEIWIPILKPGE